MARTAKKTSRKAQRRMQKRTSRPKSPGRAAKGTRRVTTRRLPGRSSRGSAGTRSSGSRSARATARAETLQVTLELRDVSDRLVRDPETFFTFRRVSDRRQIGDQLALELSGSAVTFDLPVATGEMVVCELDSQRFRFAHSPVFFRTPGPPIRRTVRLLREPASWKPRFTRWDDLPGGFAHFKRVLAHSSGCTIFKEADEAAQDVLTGDAYDRMSGDKVVLAKTALLNARHRLNAINDPVSGTRSWFSYVTQLVSIGRERFLALVEPEMETLVRQIHGNIDEFRADYERTPSENHRGNVPAAMRSRISSMISIKSTHAKGNFQLTLSHLTGPDEVLLDADIDENGELLAHFVDLFKHKVTGGTHPHDIHELLVLQDGTGTGFDLGYRLV
jgi:hypothetical protein